MKLEQITTPLIPRSTLNCIDLGLVFFGRHLPSILKLWAIFAIPTGFAVYFLTQTLEWEFWQVMIWLHFTTAPYGVILSERLIQAAFGGSFDDPEESPERTKRLYSLALKTLGMRCLSLIGFICVIIPGWWIAVRTSFLVETTCLSDLQGRKHDRRSRELIKQELGSLLQRSFVLACFLGTLLLSLFFCLDFLTSNLFDLPILRERIGDQLSVFNGVSNSLEIILAYLYSDPLVLTVEAVLALLVYPIGRFAWFFCYIDLRVRGDFWDLELRFQKEAERLGETSA